MNKTVEEVLADCLEMIERGEITPSECLCRYPEYQDELAPLLGVVQRLHRAPPVAPRAAFRQEAWSRLLRQVARTRPVEASRFSRQQRLPNRFWPPRLAKAALLLLLLLAGFLFVGGTGYAAGDALPGDPLYGMKSVGETARLIVSADDSREAMLLIQYANTRLMEIQLLIVQGRYDDVATGVRLFERDVARATEILNAMRENDPAKAAALEALIHKDLVFHQEVLANMIVTLPAPDRAVIERAIEISNQKTKDSLPSEGVIPESPFYFV